MSKTQSKLIALALVGACSFGVWKAADALFFSDEAQGTKHAVNQVWIDHVPTDDRDMITHFVLVDHRDGQFGAIGRSSQWRIGVEVFRWQLQGSDLRMYFPQERARGEVKVETWECEKEAPAPFQLCMKLTNKNGRSMTLYSRKDWEIDPQDVNDSIEDITDDEPLLGGMLQGLGSGDQLGEFDLEAASAWDLKESF
ncbi:hypothetical protein DB30_04991 [Enhygromyxa salina]|uniref:Uncharacterized protein n=1 Tax=Enhygromyxa salina TaxID=215803 RepID=A0A0C1ZEL9_9BACT|nr:hypothetical protein [Enhygromyxa salina]KIG16119.1 hypothetical protein DB30_04991 [Enhygromyxa salina]